jgi:hypothetical protein
MLEEFRAHQEDAAWEEFREINFLELLLSYLIWINFFHGKFLLARGRRVALWLTNRGRSLDTFKPFERDFEAIAQMRSELFKIREVVIPRRGVAERLSRIRLGSIIPIILTAISLVSYAILQPLSFGNVSPDVARPVASVAYALGGTALIQNFLYALWLLIPWRVSQRGAPMP